MGSSHSVEVFCEGDLEDEWQRQFGKNETSLWQAFKRAYDQLVGTIIRPERKIYQVSDLGPDSFEVVNAVTGAIAQVTRKDFELFNHESMRLQCSAWAPAPLENKGVPYIIFLHRNYKGSRLDVFEYDILHDALEAGFGVVAFDFAGSGLSGGSYVTLGFNEKQDVTVVADYAIKNLGASTLCLWGHNMGAAAAIMSGWTRSDISAMILDSPYARMKDVRDEMMNKIKREGFSAPRLVMLAGAKMIRSTIILKAGFDLELLNPVDSAKRCKAPALLVHGSGDSHLDAHHIHDIAKAYGSKIRQVLEVDCTHYGKRPLSSVRYALAFLLSSAAEKLKGSGYYPTKEDAILYADTLLKVPDRHRLENIFGSTEIRLSTGGASPKSPRKRTWSASLNEEVAGYNLLLESLLAAESLSAEEVALCKGWIASGPDGPQANLYPDVVYALTAGDLDALKQILKASRDSS